MNRVISIINRKRTGVSDATLIIADLGGAWDDSSHYNVMWPQTYRHEVKPTEWHKDLQVQIWTSSLNVWALGYDCYFTDLGDAEYQFKTLSGLHKRLKRMNDTEGYVTSFGAVVLRLARLLKADIVVHRKSFQLPDHYNDWIQLEFKYAAPTIDEYCERARKLALGEEVS